MSRGMNLSPEAQNLYDQVAEIYDPNIHAEDLSVLHKLCFQIITRPRIISRNISKKDRAKNIASQLHLAILATQDGNLRTNTDTNFGFLLSQLAYYTDYSGNWPTLLKMIGELQKKKDTRQK